MFNIDLKQKKDRLINFIKRVHISCIVPVYNNQDTVKKVITTLIKSDFIEEVIVINDGSHDNSDLELQHILDSEKITVLSTSRNKGKAWGIALGIREAKHSVIMICDADLDNLQAKHIQTLIDAFKNSDSEMVIASRSQITGPISRMFAWVSGERIFYKKNIHDQHLQLMKKAGNGVEQIINFAHRKKKVEFVVSHDIGHILKYQRGPFKKWFLEYVHEGYKLFETECRLRKVLLFEKLRSK